LSVLSINFMLCVGQTTNHVSRWTMDEDDDGASEQTIRWATCAIDGSSNEDSLRLYCRIGMTSADYDDNDVTTWMGKLFWMSSQCEISIETDVIACNVSQSYSGGGYSTTCSLVGLLAGNTTSQACTCDSSYQTYLDPYCWKNRECDTRTEESDECNECEVRKHCDCKFVEDDDYHGLPSRECWSELWQAMLASNDDDGNNNGNPTVDMDALINASQSSIKHHNIFWNMDVARCGYESGFQRPLGSRLVVPIVVTVSVGMLVAFVALFLRHRRIVSRSDDSEQIFTELTTSSLPPIS